MKILYVAPFPPSRDGIGTYTRALADAMRAEGHNVRVVVPRWAPGSPPEVMGGLGWGFGSLRKLRTIVSRWGPDVVHVQFAVGAFAARTPLLLAWLAMVRTGLRVPVVVTMHEATRDTALLRGPGRALYRLLAWRCDRIIVHTNTARGALARMGLPGTKTVTIPHPRARMPAVATTGHDLRERFHLGEARVLLAFGYIHIDKGLDDLVSALAILKRSAPGLLCNVRLVVAGAVRPRRGIFRVFEARDRLLLVRVRRLTRRGGLEEHLVMTGYVPDDDVAGWFRAAEAAVLPYRRIEQSGVAALASAFGVPLLVSTVGGLGEQYRSPWTFPPCAPDRLAIVLADFLGTAPPANKLTAASSVPDVDSVAAVTLGLYHACGQAMAGEALDVG